MVEDQWPVAIIHGQLVLARRRQRTEWHELERAIGYDNQPLAFKVRGDTTIDMTVSYRLSEYDAWVISEARDDAPWLLSARI